MMLPPIKVYVVVIDETTREPVKGAEVVARSDGIIFDRGTTNELGIATLTVPLRTYMYFTVRHPDYYTYRSPFTPVTKPEQEIKVELKELPLLITELRKTLEQTLVGKPDHFEGVVGVTPKKITPPIKAVTFFIENTHATNDLFVSFDGGKKWKKIVAGGIFSLVGHFTEIWLKASAEGTTYEGLWCLRE